MSSTSFTDAEQAFADSAEGRRTIAYAKMVHDGARGHPVNGGHPFTDAMSAKAIRDSMSAQAEASAQAPAYEARADVARHVRDAAHARMVDRECGKAT